VRGGVQMRGKFNSLEAYPAVSLLVDVSHPGDLRESMNCSV